MQDWLHGSTFTGNVATEHGTFYEEHAIADLGMQIGMFGIKGQSKFWISPDYDWLGATPDVILDETRIAEIKCPYSKRKAESVDEFKSIFDQPHYYAQVQIELHCTGRTEAIFFQWAPPGISKIEEVHADPDWLDENIPKLKSFLDEYHEREERMTNESDNIDYLGAQYIEAKAAFEKAKEELDAIRSLMIEHAQGKKTRYGAVQCYPTERKGSVSYSKVVKDHLPDLDLEPYRGKPTLTWTIK